MHYKLSHPQVFSQRPIPEAIVAYCVGDVQHLPELRYRLWRGHTRVWQEFVTEEAKKRIVSTHLPNYQPQGRERALAPWTNEQSKILDERNYVPPRNDYFDEFDDYDDWDDRCDNGFEDWTRELS
jgi:exonuclease 3'-5' domain-containing protein 1